MQPKSQHAPVTRPFFAIILSAAIIGLAAIISYSSLTLIADEKSYQHNDFLGLAQYYAQLPADTLILIPFEDEPALQVYYADHLDIEAQFLNIPLYSSPEEAIERINAAIQEGETTHIEFLTWFQLPADERGMYPCLLAGVGQQADSYFENYGLRSNTFYLDAPIQMQAIELPTQFTGAVQIMDARYVASAETVCLQVNFRLEGVADLTEYQVAADILTPAGWELAGDDSPVRRDDQAMVTVWEHGNSGAAFLTIKIPEGTPAGTYDWLIRLYSENQPSGIDVVNGEGQPLGKDLRLPPLTLISNPFETTPENSLIRRDNSSDGTLYSGQELKLELIHSSTEAEILSLQGQDFILEQDLAPGAALAWVTFRIPPDTANGEAHLLLGEQVIATYSIVQTERIFEQPDVEIETHQAFPDVGTLIGVNLPQTEIMQGEGFPLEIIWQAGEETPIADYKVFAQLLSADGRVIWQSDAEPVSGQRPTTTWVAGEYLVDSHLLHWNELEYSGKATLIVGLYNSNTAERISLPGGATYVTIPAEIEVR